MATKKTSKKNRKNNFYGLMTTIFVVTCVMYIAVCIGLKSYNVSLNRKEIELEKNIKGYQAELGTINAQISELQDYNRVVEYVDTASMKNTTAHSITVGN